MIKAAARATAERAVARARHRLRDTLLYKLYFQVRHSALARELKAEKEFYRRLLCGNNTHLVFDIGASGGAKTAIFSRVAKMIIAVEPGPAASVI